jgi:7-carboxy-7-deazaguanine synthase
MGISVKDKSLNISEIFFSIQGEGTRAGLPCVFVRLQGCKLRCKWCDTPYALKLKGEGVIMTINEIISAIKSYKCKFVQITGGEPLHQENVYQLMAELCSQKFTVALETSGAVDISNVDKRVYKIMDIKCPGSGMSKLNKFANINYITKKDEIKFVVADKTDFDWALTIIKKYQLFNNTENILISPAFKNVVPERLSGWILNSKLPVRLQLQIHKYIWKPDRRGV